MHRHTRAHAAVCWAHLLGFQVSIPARVSAVIDNNSRQQARADPGPTVGGHTHRLRHKNLKELHPGSSGRSEIRILFAFDPRRQAILLVAGDKAGAWKKWYATNIPLAEERLDAHLHALRSTPPGA